MDILNSHRFTQSLTANGQVQMAPVKFDQCAAFTSVCKNRTGSIHQQTILKKQPFGARKYTIESIYLDKREVKTEKCIFITFEISKINKIYYT